MFDEAAVREPDSFDPDRPTDNYLHLGFGHHECLGKHVAMAMVPGAVLEILLTPGVALIPGPAGFIDFQNGPFPERFVVTLNGRPSAPTLGGTLIYPASSKPRHKPRRFQEQAAVLCGDTDGSGLSSKPCILAAPSFECS